MARQSGVSILSFLLALILASVSLAITVAIGSHLLRQTNQNEAFQSVMVDVFQGIDAAISDQWQDSDCRALSEPPTLQTLVSDYHVPASVLTSPYRIAVAYRTAKRLADDVFVTERTITLYKGIASIN